MITIVDSGGANIASIQFALLRLGVSAQFTRDEAMIKQSSHIILPGVGNAAYAMDYLKQNKLIEVVRSLTQPVLGICLGMQILFDYSEEGDVDCLGIIPGKIKKLQPSQATARVPHMGWNKLEMLKPAVLMGNINNDDYVYFVHSYAAEVSQYTCARTCHGQQYFSAAVQHNNFFGMQFHPERSSLVGSIILKNFLCL